MFPGRFELEFPLCAVIGALSVAQRRALRTAIQQKDYEQARQLLIDGGLAGDPMNELVPLMLERKTRFVSRVMSGSVVPDYGVQTWKRRPDSGRPTEFPAEIVKAWDREDEDAFLKATEHHGFRDRLDYVVSRLLVRDAGDVLYDPTFDRTVLLESLRFNHTPAPDPSSSLHLRRNRIDPVCRPEWRAGVTNPASSPALYANDLHGGATPVVKALLRPAVPTFTGSVEVKADGGGMLGPIDPFTVQITGPGAIVVNVPLTHHTISGRHPPSGGVGIGIEDIVWNWSHREGGGPWRYLATSHHRIYVVPRIPQAPWDVSVFGLPNNPWTSALDVACRSFPVQLDDPIDGVAAGLCELLNPGGAAPNPVDIRYDVNGSADQHYASGGFQLGTMLLRALGGFGNGELVNCDDCAGLVVSLANLLGCDLQEQIILTQACAPVMPIGHGQWFLPQIGFIPAWGDHGTGLLLYHTVAWRGEDPAAAKVFDITYHVNGFPSAENPERPHPEVRLVHYPSGTRFSQSGALDYLEMLHPFDGSFLGSRRRRAVV